MEGIVDRREVAATQAGDWGVICGTIEARQIFVAALRALTAAVECEWHGRRSPCRDYPPALFAAYINRIDLRIKCVTRAAKFLIKRWVRLRLLPIGDRFR